MSSAAAGGILASSTPEASQNSTEQFAYDHLGNRVVAYYNMGSDTQKTVEYTHNNVNQYETINATVLGIPINRSVSYDDNGNLETDTDGNTCEYDYRNRLVSISDGTETIAEYVYDALGRRTSHGFVAKFLTVKKRSVEKTDQFSGVIL